MVSEEEFQALQKKLEQMEKLIGDLGIEVYGSKKQHEPPILSVRKNKDGLPIGMNIYGVTREGTQVVLTANLRDYQIVGFGNQELIKGMTFSSLSSAAEFFSKVQRKSGWVYWKDIDGKTLKERFKG